MPKITFHKFHPPEFSFFNIWTQEKLLAVPEVFVIYERYFAGIFKISYFIENLL